MKITEILNHRYSTKEFDPDKKISPEDLNEIKALLRMSPSSTNIQPWHFIIAGTEEGKKRISKGTQGFYQFNNQKILDASHVIVFCSRISADKNYMLQLLDREDKDGRYPDNDIKQMVYGARNVFSDMHRFELKDHQHWMEKQVYLNLGFFLMGVAALGIDALPMEGLDMNSLDKEFKLREKGFTAIASVSIGYRSNNDFNARAPKSRLPENDIFTIL